MKKSLFAISGFLSLAIILGACGVTSQDTSSSSSYTDDSGTSDYYDEAYIVVNNNVPYFTADDLTETPYMTYSELDSLGRCGVAMACIGPETISTEDSGSNEQITPTGWDDAQYDGNYLYNRCLLIDSRLSGESDNIKNLITGTRYMNTIGMLPF